MRGHGGLRARGRLGPRVHEAEVDVVAPVLALAWQDGRLFAAQVSLRRRLVRVKAGDGAVCSGVRRRYGHVAGHNGGRLCACSG